MSIAVKHNHTTIKTIHAALSDFSLELDSYSILLEKKLENMEINEKALDYEEAIILFPGRLKRLKNKVCKHHNIPLIKNSTNERSLRARDRVIKILNFNAIDVKNAANSNQIMVILFPNMLIIRRK